MQLIRSNMRGKDSKDKFFQKYPRLYYSSFQGSESSTSDGIIKVFERAKKFEKQDSDVLSLVILDEIGLAEISRFNPLKVLHSLLEPDGKDRPDVAVVGISNWALDSAKMNRAIHLSRPDMTEIELIVTGQSIMESVVSHSSLDLNLENIAKAYLDYTAKQPIKNFHGLRDYYAFVKYISREVEKIQQPVSGAGTFEIKNFLLLKGLLRNFGGQQMNNDTLRKTFCHRMTLDGIPMVETRDLIMENIVDSEARHLMLILDGDSALGSIENIVQEMNKDFTTILGSRFLDDQDDEYNYRVLNRIILCMEQPQVLILKDLDDIYGSLYDMLNQNYTIVQGKKHCRVALGPFSNPTCEVNDEFKCIVIIDESNIEKTDPPFLNRFEKQQYLLKDILKPKNISTAENLEILISEMSSYEDADLLFDLTDAFPIAGKEMFTSLVAVVEQKLVSKYMEEFTGMQLFYYCIIELLWIMKPDCILRMDMSKAWTNCKRSLEFLIDMYMSLPIHNGLEFYLKEMSKYYEGMSLHAKEVNSDKEDVRGEALGLVPHELKDMKGMYFGEIKDDDSVFDAASDDLEGNTQMIQDISENEWKAPFAMEEEIAESVDSYFDVALHDSDTHLMEKVSRVVTQKQQIYLLKQCDGLGAKMVVFTYSTIYCKVQDAISDLDCVVRRLSEYKSEKNFTSDIETFFEVSQDHFFVLQCDMRTEYQHILLAKAIIENGRKRLVKKEQRKHVCIVIHITRRSNPLQMFNKINFSTGWTLATLDSLEKTMFPLPDLYNKAVLDVLGAKEQAFSEIICRELPWASSKIQYQGITDNMIDVQEIRNSKAALNIISEQIQNWIKRHCVVEDNMDWQHKAACDKHLLETSTTMIGTLGSHMSGLIQEPLARILYCIENSGILNCLLSLDEMKPELKEIFQKGCDTKDFYDVDAAPQPAGPGCYLINVTTSHLKVPFSKAVFRNLENFKSEVLGDVRRANIILGYLQVADNEELRETMLAIVHAYTEQIEKETELLDVQTFDHIMDDVKEDFCHYTTSTIDCKLSEGEKISLMKWILKNLIGDSQIYDVHSFLMTLHLWTWTYFQSIVGIFHLIDLWKTRDENVIFILHSNPTMNTTSIFENLKHIVDLICQELLIQCMGLEKHQLENWQKGVYKFMTIIGVIGVSSHKIETLKFLNDFMSVIFIPRKCDISPLNQFASYISHFDWNLVRVEVFGSLWQHLKSIKEKKEANSVELQQITCSFIARCNVSCDSDSERENINLRVVKMIGEGEIFDDSLQFFGHCLKLSLIDYFPEEDDDLESHLFLQILEKCNDENMLDEFLRVLHAVLQTKTVSPSLSAIFVSTLQDEVYEGVITNEKLGGIMTRNDFLLCKMFQARDILKDHDYGLPYCAAVSYMKQFLSSMAILICQRMCQNNHLFYACDQILCSATEYEEQRTMRKFFFESLQRNVGEIEVFKISKELSESLQFFSRNSLLPTAEDLGSSVLSLNLARYCNDSNLSRLNTLPDISEDRDFLMKILENERDYIISILCFLHSRVFHVESFSTVADFDRSFGESVERAIVDHRNSKVKLLIKHLMNQHSCGRRILRHDFNASPEATSLTIFLIHIASLILINDSKASTLYRAAIHHEIPSGIQRKGSILTSFEIRNCECNHRIATSEDQTCPWCSSSSKTSNCIPVKKPLDMNPYSSIVRALLIDAALVTTVLFEDVISEFGLKEVESRELNFVSNWQRLRSSLQISDDEQCQLLIIFLENVEEIFSDQNFSLFEWNQKYDAILKKVLHERHHQLRREDKRHKELLARMMPTAYKEQNDEHSEGNGKTLLFNITEKPSIQNLYFELHLSKSGNEFPCLNMILENFDMLQFPQYVEGILQWHRLLIGKCSYSLKKVDCKYMSAGSFINQQNKEIQRKLRESFKEFSDTWEQICYHVKELEHHTTKLPSIEKITEDSKMDLCILKDKDSVVFQVLHALCSVQNTLLDKVLETCVNFNCKSLGFINIGNFQAAVPVVSLMDLQKKHVVEAVLVDESEKRELFAQCGYGKESRCIAYDFRKIEVEWAYKIFHNRAYIMIDETMMFMEFKDDLYGHCVQLLQKVSAQIPQTVLDSTTETKIKERLDEDPSQVPQLLTVIGAVTTVIMRRKTIEKHVHISEFVERLEGLNVAGVSNKCLLPFKEYDLTLGKVVAFYTLLEEVNGEKYFSALDTEFRDVMQDRTKRQITAVISGRIALLKACESAMHVFLHRFLYIRDNDISLQQQIVDYLSNSQLWRGVQIVNQRIRFPETEFEILLQDVFPQELQVKHVYKFLELLKEQIKLHETRTHIPKMAFGSSKRSRKQKKLAGNF